MIKAKIIKYAGVSGLMGLLFFTVASAQMMGGGTMMGGTGALTNPEELAGQTTWNNLKTGKTTCTTLVEKDFELLGDYFMGIMMGPLHETMDKYMADTFGEEKNSQIHVTMGKRTSGCDKSAVYPAGFSGFMPMMGGTFSPSGYSPVNNANNMMNYGYGLGYFGWIYMVLWWVLVIIAIFGLVRWMRHGSGIGGRSRSALAILHERYAKGEIDRKEFEEKKKDLTS
jgi:putative membrane protein